MKDISFDAMVQHYLDAIVLLKAYGASACVAASDHDLEQKTTDLERRLLKGLDDVTVDMAEAYREHRTDVGNTPAIQNFNRVCKDIVALMEQVEKRL